MVKNSEKPLLGSPLQEDKLCEVNYYAGMLLDVMTQGYSRKELTNIVRKSGVIEPNAQGVYDTNIDNIVLRLSTQIREQNKTKFFNKLTDNSPNGEDFRRRSGVRLKEHYSKFMEKGLQPIMNSDSRFMRLFNLTELTNPDGSYAKELTNIFLADTKTEGGRAFQKVPFIDGVAITPDYQRTGSAVPYERIDTNGNPQNRQVAIHADISEVGVLNTETSSLFNVTPFTTAYADLDETQRNEMFGRRVSEVLNAQFSMTNKLLETRRKQTVRAKNNRNSENSQRFVKTTDLEKTKAPEMSFYTDYRESQQYQNWVQDEKDFKDGLRKFVNPPNAHEQIDAFLAPFLSNNDLKDVKKNLDSNYTYAPDVLNRARGLLEHLHDNGVDYSVVPNEGNSNQLSIKVSGANNEKIRVLDKNDEVQYIGRVYSPMGELRLKLESGFAREGTGSEKHEKRDARYKELSSKNRKDLTPKEATELSQLRFSKGKENDWKSSNPYKAIDYALGLDIGKLKFANSYDADSNKYGLTTFGVHFEDSNNELYYNPSLGRIDAIRFDREEEAIATLNGYIATAKEMYLQQLDSDDFIYYLDDMEDVQEEIQRRVNEQLMNEELLTEDEEARYKNEVNPFDVLDATDEENNNLEAKLRPVLDENSSERDKRLREIRSTIANDLVNETIGDLENGFNASKVEILNNTVESFYIKDSMVSAMKRINYDISKLKGDDFDNKAIKNSLIMFNADTALFEEDLQDGFRKSMVQHVTNELSELGIAGFDYDPETNTTMRNPNRKPDVAIDENGIIRWSGYRRVGGVRKKESNVKYEFVEADIGQVFDMNEKGIVDTQFASGDNYLFVPGYTGYFQYSGSREDQDRMERFRVTGFEQMTRRKLTASVREQVLRPRSAISQSIETGIDTTRMNELYYKDVYGTRFDYDWYQKNALKDEVKDLILETYNGRIRLNDMYERNATTFAVLESQKAVSKENAILESLHGKNVRQIHSDMKGYVDMMMTSTNKVQGLVMYLADGTEVNENGVVKPAPITVDENGKEIIPTAPLRKLDYFNYADFNAWDRNQMSPNQLLTAYHVDEDCHSALIPFGGWNFDDAYVVSKEFAERNMIFGMTPNPDSMNELNSVLESVKDSMTNDSASFKEVYDKLDKSIQQKWTSNELAEGIDLVGSNEEADVEAYKTFLETHGRYRPLKRGDKISDFGGNKGAISLVIDRNMSAEEAKEMQLEREIAIMKANPKLDVIGASYSVLTRHNAGVPKELMNSKNVEKVLDENGNELGWAGDMNVIVTNMLADKKSVAYTEEDLAEGKGRRISAQLVWGLNEMGADALVEEAFAHNTSSWNTFREYLVAVGVDMEKDGTLVFGYHPREGEEREVVIPNPEKTTDEFLRNPMIKGGLLKIPFEYENASGIVQEEGSYLPILPAKDRANTKLASGETQIHHYTRKYGDIYEKCCEVIVKSESLLKQKEMLDELRQSGAPASTIKNAEFSLALSQDELTDLKHEGEKAILNLQSAIINDKLGGYTGNTKKHSHIRERLMAKRTDYSATGIITPDPRLDLETVAVSPKIYASLDLKSEDELVAIWRDPVLRDGAIRAMKVVVDDSLEGIAINPIIDKSFDGDFDGDTFAIKAFKTPKAQAQLKELARTRSNLIDKGTEKGDSYLNISMDVVSGAVQAGIVEPVTENDFDDEGNQVGSPKKRLQELFKDIANNSESEDVAMQRTNELVHNCLRNNFGSASIDLDSVESMHSSLEKMVLDGAKGSPSGLKEYMEYFNGEKTIEDAQKVQLASGIKSDLTGQAGSFSQKFIALLRDVDPKTALESSYVITQGTLQIKKDAQKGEKLALILSRDLDNLYNGRPRDWEYTKNGEKPEPLSVNQFKKDVSSIYRDELGVDLRDEHLDTLANVLSNNTDTILGMKKMMDIYASPIDQIAYGKGFESIRQIARNGDSLARGEKSALIMPKKMREHYAGREERLEKERLAEQETTRASRYNRLKSGNSLYQEKSKDAPKTAENTHTSVATMENPNTDRPRNGIDKAISPKEAEQVELLNGFSRPATSQSSKAPSYVKDDMIVENNSNTPNTALTGDKQHDNDTSHLLGKQTDHVSNNEKTQPLANENNEEKIVTNQHQQTNESTTEQVLKQFAQTSFEPSQEGIEKAKVVNKQVTNEAVVQDDKGTEPLKSQTTTAPSTEKNTEPAHVEPKNEPIKPVTQDDKGTEPLKSQTTTAPSTEKNTEPAHVEPKNEPIKPVTQDDKGTEPLKSQTTTAPPTEKNTEPSYVEPKNEPIKPVTQDDKGTDPLKSQTITAPPTEKNTEPAHVEGTKPIGRSRLSEAERAERERIRKEMKAMADSDVLETSEISSPQEEKPTKRYRVRNEGVSQEAETKEPSYPQPKPNTASPSKTASPDLEM